MATIDSAVYCEALMRQCKIALEAIGNLNYALMNLYQVPSGGSRYDTYKAEVFELIYAFLGHAARISWMLWPGTEGKIGRHRRRRQKIEGTPTKGSFSQCTVPKAPETSKTRSLKMLRRAYPFAAALQNEISGAMETPAACHIIGSPIAVMDCSSSAGMRIYDPTTRDFHMDGIIFPLQEIAAAIALLYSHARVEEKPSARVSPADTRRRFSDVPGNGVREAVHL